MTAWVVAAAHNLGLVVRRKQALHTVLEHKEEVVARKAAAEAVQAAHSTKAAAVPIEVAHTAVEVADRVVVRKAIVVAGSNLVAAVDLDRKTWIIPSCQMGNQF